MSDDPLKNLGTVLRSLRAVQAIEEEAVLQARLSGATWADIAKIYGVSRQAAHARWAKKEEQWQE